MATGALTFTPKDVPDQSGRRVLVTGATAGIGWETARVLAVAGASVLLGARSAERGAAAKQRILAEHPRAEVDVVQIDLASLRSIEAGAQSVIDRGGLDVLINNAGVMVPPLERTEDGFESQLGINHLGHFALTGLLLPNLLRSVAPRVVVVASHAHRFGRINFDDLNAERGYVAVKCYAQSKLANMLFTQELARRSAAVASPLRALACHPGGADTELSRHLPAAAVKLTPAVRWVLNSALEGALPTLRATVDPDAQSGDYFGPAGFLELARGAKRVRFARRAQDPILARKLWDVSVGMTGIAPELAA